MIATPLFKFLTKDFELKWDNDFQSSFETLKLKLLATPILTGPNWSIPFHIYIDASNIDLGVGLEKKDNQTYYAMYFVSKNLTLT